MKDGGKAVMARKSEILRRWQLISPYLDQRQTAFWAAAEAEVIGSKRLPVTGWFNRRNISEVIDEDKQDQADNNGTRGKSYPT
jgi:hypothetical protein